MKYFLAFLLVAIGIDGLMCAHSGQLDDQNRLSGRQRKDIQDVINKWNHWGATVRDNAGTLFTSGLARIDLQGTSRVDGKLFHRYAVQLGSGTYSEIHIQYGEEFGVGLIRAAFEQSRNHRAHVFIARERVRVSPPNDGKSYRSRLITRKWKKQFNKTVIWSTQPVIDYMARRFDKKPF